MSVSTQDVTPTILSDQFRLIRSALLEKLSSPTMNQEYSILKDLELCYFMRAVVLGLIS